MSLIINDAIFLRRPTLNYVCPPVCENLFSSTGFPVIVLNPVPRHGAPIAHIDETDEGFQLGWDPYPGAICFNIYQAVNPAFPNGAYALIKECVPGLITPVEIGCYRVTAITIDGESDFSNIVCTPNIPPPTPPEVTTDPATDVEITSAVLNGTANPHGLETTVYFEWGTTTAYGNTTAPQSVGSGNSPIGFSESLTGLITVTQYHYRAVATNAAGTVFGLDEVFTTDCDQNYPATLADLDSWWKADAIVGLNSGDPVSLWPDSSGTNDAIGSGATRPLWIANTFGDKPIVRFNGIDSELLLTNLMNLLPGTPFTLIVVFAWGAGAVDFNIFFGRVSNSNHINFEHDFNIAGVFDNTNSYIFGPMTTPQTEGRALITRYTGSDFVSRENLTQVSAVSSLGFSGAFFDIFGHYSPFIPPIYDAKMDVAEIILFQRSLTDVEADEIYTKYLRCKYSNLP